MIRKIATVFLILFTLCLAGCTSHQRPTSLAGTVNYYAPQADARLAPYFRKAHIAYPPQHLALLVFKHEKKLEVWGCSQGKWALVKTYSILAASGGPGPKLREGDRQVPEGVYQIVGFNQRSRFHLSLALNYPNDFDRYHARSDGRGRLGGDIFIHGKEVSIGCIAIGDRAIEELFVLIYKTGAERTQVIIAPNDLRAKSPPITVSHNAPRWVPALYQDISLALTSFRSV